MTPPALPAAPLPRRGQQRADWRLPVNPTAAALAVVERAHLHTGLVLAVARDPQSALRLEADLKALARGLPVLHFPDWETLPYDLFSPHPDIISERVAALYRLPSLSRGVLVVPVSTLLQRLAPPAWIAGNVLDLKRGQKLDLDTEKRRLQAAGYRHVPQVNDPGDFSVRGALLDLFPTGSAEPYRIELFDDRIESLRSFDPETQRSLHVIEAIELLPARELPLDEASCRRAREALIERFDAHPRRCPLVQDLKEGVTPAGIEYYLPLFFEHTASLFEHVPKDALVVLDAAWEQAAEQQILACTQRWEQRRHDIERPVLPPEELLLRPDELRAALNRHVRIEQLPAEHPRWVEAFALEAHPAPDLPLARKGEPAAAALRVFLSSYPGRVLIAADSPGRREALIEVLAAADLKPPVVADWAGFLDSEHRYAIGVVPLDAGFALAEPALTVLTERQLFPEKAEQSRRRSRRGLRDPDTIIKDLAEIGIGSPIVHEAHGVGRYRGLEVLKAGGVAGEYLVIEYAKGDKLYVPVAQLERVSRYSGASAEHAPLHSLGGEAWEKARKRAAEKVRDVAAELLEIQARRQARAGLALALDRSMYEPFAATFPFEETPDQLAAIEAVIADLGKAAPMDRVVCGDVGFGKTEVAVRAAFVAATAGKQVAVLVPTTLLAEQHYRNFRDRFADWPIRVEVLSRFKSPKEIKAVLAEVAEGKVDVIVGTHRLLQEDVKFKDAGLVIVDEEQRFGVRQKERLKALRAEVHLLTLTATPIPRTLNMAMSGLRDLSIIATPPAHRLAVKTFVAAWEDATIIEACQRELARGGQVYFLHNEVDTIEVMARDLTALVPDARIRIAHGQMPERELEQVMLDFHRQRFNVLVCTTIIESGIDIPSANTIIVNRADKFGLAQLHQLRGRVGRSHHRAYCYLVVPPKLTTDAEKRLEALAAIEELGAGFMLATHDLEIRGAGELLGEEQSGQIAEVGFSLYTELLERAVRSIKAGRIPDVDASAPIGPEVNLNIPALLPDDYLPDVHARLTQYKRISAAKSVDRLKELQVELVDRFGVLPDPAKHLFAISELKLEATRLGIRKLDLGPSGGRLVFEAKPRIDPMSVIRMIQGQPKVYAMDGPEKLKMKLELPDAGSRLRAARALFATLAQG
ncbi:transcription-repair coupling factor [Silanimonas sp.]|uniref:transcription-repair coupling factor n=1 Tax=Silanimonas sp. TaxID=1929290 RepID=UPI001BB92F15|nr:transcription-repair coupling factor [Silanimonas sp.]MBS3896061.1 transcription-repair coupling factor [Silanimonas sp.]